MRQDIKERIEQINQGVVPSGYKMTSVGIYPIDWKLKPLGSISKFIGGGTPSTKIGEYWNGDIPWISSSDVVENNIYKISVSRKINNNAINNSATKLIPSNSVLVVTRVGVGKVVVNKFPLCTSQDYTNVVRFNHNSIFLAYYLRSLINKKLHGLQGTSIKGITTKELASFLVLHFKIEEQTKIADVLTTWDNAVELQEKKIEKLQEKKKALMQKLLTPKPDWKEVKLGDILHERNEYMQKGQSLTHVTLSKEGVVDKTERYERDFLVKDENKKYKVTKLNDICYNPANLKFGVICRNNYGSAIFSPIYVTYEVKNDNDPMFVEHFITRKDFINQVRKYEQGTVYERMAVHSDDFLNFKTSIPKPEQQQKIAKVLSMADDQIELHQNELKQLGKQKKSLMQLLLTGIVRV